MPVDLPKSMLQKLLMRYNTQRDTLTPDEQGLCERICFCVLCGYFWVRRIRKTPKRCPDCHKPGWNMPFVAALIGRPPTDLMTEILPQRTLKEAPPDGQHQE